MNYLDELKGEVLQDRNGKRWRIQGCREFEPTDTSYLHGILKLENTDTGEEREVDLMVSGTMPQERFRNLLTVLKAHHAEILDATAPIEVRINEGGGGGIYVFPVRLN
jgi:hypothetical protein